MKEVLSDEGRMMDERQVVSRQFLTDDRRLTADD
jgi:hypothetical protein